MSARVEFGPARRVPNAWSMVKACLVLRGGSRSLGDGDDDGVIFALVGEGVAIFGSGNLTRIRGIILIHSCLRWKRRWWLTMRASSQINHVEYCPDDGIGELGEDVPVN